MATTFFALALYMRVLFRAYSQLSAPLSPRFRGFSMLLHLASAFCMYCMYFAIHIHFYGLSTLLPSYMNPAI